MPSVMWFRRDLRLADNPALNAAIAAGGDEGVVALFVLDPHYATVPGLSRLNFLVETLRDLDARIGGKLVFRAGRPDEVVPALAGEVGADRVFCTEDFEPYGLGRDEHVAKALADTGRKLEPVDSPYAVAPGSIVKKDGSPFAVFSPFMRAWTAHGWGSPLPAPLNVAWRVVDGVGLPEVPTTGVPLPPTGEDAAQERFESFLGSHGDTYDVDRNHPAVDGTSRLSPYLRFGTLHPRQLLSRLGSSRSHVTFRNELCWRDFYADVLFHAPGSLSHSIKSGMASMQLNEGPEADAQFEAWTKGQTGYPIVDAGMRQLLAEGWMHNRVRMIVASFLVKDLHIDWVRGAEWFTTQLLDHDPASNAHGWQWVAGTGTDPAPYFRIFNPTVQGKKFDEDGAYVRRWIPELRNAGQRFVHEPWKDPAGLPDGYPAPIVDHAVERAEALRRFGKL